MTILHSPHVTDKPQKLVDSLLEKIYEQQQTIAILEGELTEMHEKLLIKEAGRWGS